ncbi:MAG: response regulator [Terrimicrobiaceae bacterium]|nr:response regulator [Terrimicrobiaceae bacterium]
MKLLVVDDQDPVGEIISRIAQQSGWEAIHTVASERIDQIIRAENVDVLLLDYAVNGNPHAPRNGLTITAELREQGIDIPVILFTGWPALIDATRAEKLGVMHVLEKPLGIQELRKCLAAARRRRQDESVAGPVK